LQKDVISVIASSVPFRTLLHTEHLVYEHRRLYIQIWTPELQKFAGGWETTKVLHDRYAVVAEKLKGF
jgi:hypothetical protein